MTLKLIGQRGSFEDFPFKRFITTGSGKTIWFKPHNGSSFVHWVPGTRFTSSGGSFYSVVEYWVCIGINPVIWTSADDPNDERGLS